MTDFFNIEYPRVGGNSNKVSSDGAFVTRDVRSIVLGTVEGAGAGDSGDVSKVVIRLAI